MIDNSLVVVYYFYIKYKEESMNKKKTYSIITVGCGSKGADLSLTPGEYETAVQGYGGEIKVKTILSESKIEKVEILENSETEGIGSTAIEQLPEAIVNNQTLDIDAVAGATTSSEAILSAVEEAVAEAGGDVAVLKGASK